MKKFSKLVAIVSAACIAFSCNQVTALADDFVIPVETLNQAGINALISECTTSYRVGEDRSQNIETAANYLNGTVLLPGQLFSYDLTIHPRTEANGYGKGNAIVGGKHVKVIGGGICQVSSTLNNAVLQAGIIPAERHNHSTGVNYLPSGLDATVSAGTLDYKFLNTLSYPIYIQAIASGGKLKVALYSNVLATNGITYRTSVAGGVKKNTTYIVGYSNGVEVCRYKAYSSFYK